jgi:dolichol-phosphate mannosyltransferase
MGLRMADAPGTILVFIPCYRCADQIGRVISGLDRAALPGIARVLVVDNGSPDDTVANAAWALEKSRFQDWQVVVNDRNVSLGGSHKVAFAHARKNGFSHVLIVHGDDQAEPANFKAPMEDGVHLRHDAVLGSRFMPESTLTGYGRFRIFGNHVFNTLFRLATRRPILDLGSGLNLYGPAILAAEDERPACDDLTFHCDLLITMIERGRDLHYVPVDWREDDQVSNAKLVRQSWRILKILGAHALRRPAPAGPGKHSPAADYTSTIAAQSYRTVVRTSCAVCGSAHMRPTGVRFSLPAYQGCVPKALPDALQMRPTMDFDACEACGSAQIVSPLPPEVIYQGGHATGLGAAWADHHRALSQFIATHSDGPILEFGGGAGTLAQAYRTRESDAERRPWTIVEPNPVTSDGTIPDLTYRIGFFGPGTRIPAETGTVLFCHCLEHLPSVDKAARQLAEQLPHGRRVVVAWPDLERWIDKGVPGAINWEHTFFCRIETLTDVFARAGFRLDAHETFGPGHSHFLAFTRAAVSAPDITPGDRPVDARIAAYFDSFRDQARALNTALAGRAYYLAPASIYAQALLAAGLAPNCRGLIDNAPIKQGRTLYGTGLTVQSPSILGPDDVLVLNGGAHAAEMAKGFLAQQPNLTILFADLILAATAGKAA